MSDVFLDPFATERPDDPRGGFQSSPEGCIAGTAWGGNIPLDGSEPRPVAYQDHTTGSVTPINPPAP
jgi:hypothetical protein